MEGRGQGESGKGIKTLVKKIHLIVKGKVYQKSYNRVQTCKKTQILHKQVLCQKYFTRKSAKITTQKILDKTA